MHLIEEIVFTLFGKQTFFLGLLAGNSSSLTIDEWKRCEVVAKVIAHCPRQIMSPDDYFRAVGPQLLALLRCTDLSLVAQHVRVAVSTVSNMMTQHIALTLKHVIQPLLQPLIQCINYPGPHHNTSIAHQPFIYALI